MSTLSQSLRTMAFEGVAEDRRLLFGVGAVAFALATAAGAQVAVPLPWTPVPVTLQPLFVILAGVLLGPRLGAISIAAYVTMGALGAPVFSNGAAGLAWLFGPTGGYLLAAPAAALIAGVVAGRDGPAWRLALGLTAGVAVMYLGGVSQLMALTGQGVGATLSLGVVPFLVGDLTKIAVAFFAVGAARYSRRLGA